MTAREGEKRERESSMSDGGAWKVSEGRKGLAEVKRFEFIPLRAKTAREMDRDFCETSSLPEKGCGADFSPFGKICFVSRGRNDCSSEVAQL